MSPVLGINPEPLVWFVVALFGGLVLSAVLVVVVSRLLRHFPVRPVRGTTQAWWWREQWDDEGPE